MTFGVDLGTTNSLIGRGEEIYTGLISSSVDTSTWTTVGREVVGHTIVSSYKTDMGLSDDSALAVECSSVVLDHLKRITEARIDEKVHDLVISVPAYFTTSQREAVVKAAETAGVNVVRLINEPTAAALYVCRKVKDLVVVYDLGGGTFDVSIVDSRIGNYTVVATKGIVLGGDDLDKAIAADMLKRLRVPIRLRDSLFIKRLEQQARYIKEQLQKKTNDDDVVTVAVEHKSINAEYALTLREYKAFVEETFGRTIAMTHNLIAENIPSSEQPKVVFVGGSTIDPHLRALLKAEFEWEELQTDIAADWVVARGVALYAEMWDEGTAWEQIDDVTKRISIEDVTGRSITVIDNNSVIPCENSITVFNSIAGKELTLRFYQGSELFAKNNEYIGTMVYKYQEEQLAGQGAVSISTSVSADGIITIAAYEMLYGEGTLQNIKLSLK